MEEQDAVRTATVCHVGKFFLLSGYLQTPIEYTDEEEVVHIMKQSVNKANSSSIAGVESIEQVLDATEINKDVVAIKAGTQKDVDAIVGQLVLASEQHPVACFVQGPQHIACIVGMDGARYAVVTASPDSQQLPTLRIYNDIEYEFSEVWPGPLSYVLVESAIYHRQPALKKAKIAESTAEDKGKEEEHEEDPVLEEPEEPPVESPKKSKGKKKITRKRKK